MKQTMTKPLKREMRAWAEGAITTLGRTPGLAGLKITPGRAGFFGEVFCALNGLRLAERSGLSAQMAWGPDSLYYDSAHAVAGDAWRSFFAQSHFDFRTGAECGAGLRDPLVYLPYKPGANDFEAYPELSARASVGKALHAWCQPHPEIAAEADAVWSQLTKGRAEMLGVHIRLTDAAAGKEGRNTVKLDHFFAAADDWLDTHPEAGLFLATDESHITEAFKDRYGVRVAFQDCLRSEDGTSIHGHYDAGVAGSPYQKGREVFVDALLLARSSHILRTHSRVTVFSLCWAPDLSYRDLEYEVTGALRTAWLHDNLPSLRRRAGHSAAPQDVNSQWP